MGKHINFFGYSLWIPNDTPEEPDEKRYSSKRLYSPGVLAAYCIFTSLFVGIILYGINVCRRGYLWKGRILIALSSISLIVLMFASALNPLSLFRLQVLLNAFVALSLYTVEKPHFQRALRNGNKPARWWLPLTWIAIATGAVWLLQMLLV